MSQKIATSRAASTSSQFAFTRPVHRLTFRVSDDLLERVDPEGQRQEVHATSDLPRQGFCHCRFKSCPDNEHLQAPHDEEDEAGRRSSPAKCEHEHRSRRETQGNFKGRVSSRRASAEGNPPPHPCMVQEAQVSPGCTLAETLRG
eukprot:745864-Hanusia_phi.AAC.1